MTVETDTTPAESTPDGPVQIESGDHLTDVVASNDVVLVDFYADWCGPCQMMEPTLETVAAETDAAVLKVDVDQFQQLAGTYQVQGIPTLLVFVDGELADRMVGVQSEDQLRAAVLQAD